MTFDSKSIDPAEEIEIKELLQRFEKLTVSGQSTLLYRMIRKKPLSYLMGLISIVAMEQIRECQ